MKADGCDAKPTIENLPDTADDGTKATRTPYANGNDGAEVVLMAIQGGGHT